MVVQLLLIPSGVWRFLLSGSGAEGRAGKAEKGRDLRQRPLRWKRYVLSLGHSYSCPWKIMARDFQVILADF